MTKPIIFDGQVFQSAAWDRGMGKYSLSLLREMISHKQYDYTKTYVILSSHLELSADAKKAVHAAAPDATFVSLDLSAPRMVPREDIRPLQKHNKAELENFITSNQIEAADFVILSLFIDQVCSVFPDNTRKVLLFYDLIPLQYSERYSDSWGYPNYLTRFSVLFAADLVLTISQTVADDLVVYTGINPAKLHNIDGAPIRRSQEPSAKPASFTTKRFVLMPTGNEIRKNNQRAIQAFEEYRRSYNDPDVELVLTSHFDDYTQKNLKRISDTIRFVGNVSEAELRWLYEHAQALLFVTEYEGLGLPVLEAVESKLPVVCSSLTVFNEMSNTAFYYTDQYNPTNIAEGLHHAMMRSGFKSKLAEYPAILKRYTWPQTAQSALGFLKKHQAKKESQPKPRLAVLAPNPSGYSAIGKVVMLTHAALSELFEVDYYLEDGKSKKDFSRASYLHAVAPVFRATEFTAQSYTKYDAVIYHMGNSEYHLESIKNALYLPGYIIAHDTRLKDLFEEVLHRFGYMDAGRLAAERKLSETSKSTKVAYMTSLVNSQLGAFVHSDYAKQAITPINEAKIPITVAHLPVGTPLMKKLKPDTGKFKVGFGGIIHKAKGIDIVDSILAADELDDVEVHIFGVPLIDPAVLARLESNPRIHIEKNLTDFQFENRLADMDVVVSYRPSYNGETSLTVLEAMRYGVVPIVRSIGWFDELPDDCVQKVPDETKVIEAIKTLKSQPTLLKQKSIAARELMASSYSYDQYAQSILQMIDAGRSDTLNGQIADLLKVGASKLAVINLLKKQG